VPGLIDGDFALSESSAKERFLPLTARGSAAFRAARRAGGEPARAQPSGGCRCISVLFQRNKRLIRCRLAIA